MICTAAYYTGGIFTPEGVGYNFLISFVIPANDRRESRHVWFEPDN